MGASRPLPKDRAARAMAHGSHAPWASNPWRALAPMAYSVGERGVDPRRGAMANERWDEGRPWPRPTLERPIGPLAPEPRFGSDVVADTLRALDLAYIAL